MTSAISSISSSTMPDALALAPKWATAPQGIALAGRMRSIEDINKSARDFEGMFLSHMLQPMFSTVSVNSSFGGGHGEDVMRGLLVQEYGKVISAKGGLGIADHIKQEMLRKQNIAYGLPANALPSSSSPSTVR